MGGNCLQLFSFSPRSWKKRELSPEEIEQFLDTREKFKVDPIFFHAIYLINLADEGETGRRSIDHLTHELKLAQKLGLAGSIIHLGSYKREKSNEKYRNLLKNIQRVLKEIPRNLFFIIENAGTRKIGQTITEIAQIINDLQHPQVKICLDTCHLHAAGYDLSTLEKLNRLLDNFDQKVGLEKLVCWHLNDSRDPLGSLRDRHENIGEGHVGLKTFENILNHPLLKKLPMIIETPGFSNRGPDAQNLKILRDLIK